MIIGIQPINVISLALKIMQPVESCNNQHNFFERILQECSHEENLSNQHKATEDEIDFANYPQQCQSLFRPNLTCWINLQEPEKEQIFTPSFTQEPFFPPSLAQQKISNSSDKSNEQLTRIRQLRQDQQMRLINLLYQPKTCIEEKEVCIIGQEIAQETINPMNPNNKKSKPINKYVIRQSDSRPLKRR